MVAHNNALAVCLYRLLEAIDFGQLYCLKMPLYLFAMLREGTVFQYNWLNWMPLKVAYRITGLTGILEVLYAIP